MARLLVTGASGLLGANLVLEASADHEVVAVCHNHPIRLPGVRTECADLTQPEETQRVMEGAAPEWVIHSAAEADVEVCEGDPVRAHRLNCDMAGYVAEAARAARARLVHISTDAVFDGRRGGYREEDEPNPINVYGRTKLEGEWAVLAAHPDAVIARTNFFGWNALPKLSLVEWFLQNLEAGRPFPGFTDVTVSPILVNHLAPLLLRMLASTLTGIYHVVGREMVSKYELGVALATAGGLDPALVRPTSVDEADLRAARPKRLNLSVEKIRAELEIDLPGVRVGLQRFLELRRDGYVSRLRAAGDLGGPGAVQQKNLLRSDPGE